jgi:hypothetical protein
MHIAGHVGFTLGAATLIQKVRKCPPLPKRQLLIFAFIALLPDILDKSFHRLIPGYPDHLLFHSLILYAVMLLALWRFHSRFLVYVAIMAFHPILDLANDDPRYLIFPLLGWPGWSHAVEPLAKPVMERLPSFLSATIWSGHYLVFELAGAVLTVWSFRESANTHKRSSRDSE